MSRKIRTDAQFLASPDRTQRRHFLVRETDRRERLQAALAELSRGFGAIGSLHAEALATALADDGGD